MVAATVSQTRGISPNVGKKMLYIQTAASADSANTIDVSDSSVTGGETLASVDWVVCYDQTTGDVVTATVSTTTITIDATGGTTNHTYALIVVGDA